MGELAIQTKDIVDVVVNKIKTLENNRELFFPANYSPENAMKSAWLKLQETKDKSGKSVLETCSKNSIANALLNMTIQGLNPAKQQCYFISYGTQLTMMRSYHGSIALLKQLDEVVDVYAAVVYEGDEFEYQIVKGKKVITKHTQKPENIDSKKIKYAYCTVELKNGKEDAEIMNMDQIRNAWKKSKASTTDANSNHVLYAEEMVKRTVINRQCKKYINSSDDSNLNMIRNIIKNNDEQLQEIQIDEEIQENANQEFIDIVVDEDTGEIIEDDTSGAGF